MKIQNEGGQDRVRSSNLKDVFFFFGGGGGLGTLR